MGDALKALNDPSLDADEVAALVFLMAQDEAKKKRRAQKDELRRIAKMQCERLISERDAVRSLVVKAREGLTRKVSSRRLSTTTRRTKAIPKARLGHRQRARQLADLQSKIDVLKSIIRSPNMPDVGD